MPSKFRTDNHKLLYCYEGLYDIGERDQEIKKTPDIIFKSM